VADKLKGLKVNPNTAVGTIYSQVVGVTVTDTEVTLEFVYVNPRLKDKGNVVSRITMPHSAALGLAEVVSKTIKKYESTKSKPKSPKKN